MMTCIYIVKVTMDDHVLGGDANLLELVARLVRLGTCGAAPATPRVRWGSRRRTIMATRAMMPIVAIMAILAILTSMAIMAIMASMTMIAIAAILTIMAERLLRPQPFFSGSELAAPRPQLLAAMGARGEDPWHWL